MCLTVPVWAQVWQPARGEGALITSYQNAHGGDHYDGFGQVVNVGPIRSSSVLVGVEYGITDRIAAGAQVPYVVSKFTLSADLQPGPHQERSTIDDGRYRGTFQDFRARIRYNVLQDPAVVTPFFEVVIPTHGYETFGHSAAGKHLKQYRVGGNVSRWLDPVVPRAYINLQPVYSFVESLADLNLDYIAVDLEVGYDLDRYAFQAFGGIEKVLGGLQQPVSPTSPYFEIHDRVGREAFSHAGGGVTFRLSRNTEFFAIYNGTLSAKNVHAYATVTAGVNWYFKTRRSRNTLHFPDSP